MDRAIINSIIRFGLLWALQVFVLKQIAWGWGGQSYLQVQLYPLFVLLLPLRMPRPLVVFLGFLLGISIDLMYETLGMHAAALVFTAYVRYGILQLLLPREGYALTDKPTKDSLGDVWFLRYAALVMFVHLLFYFSVEAFTFMYIGTILLKLVISWVVSMAFLLAAVYVFNPKM